VEYRYCPRCATELETRPSDGPDPDRMACRSCGFVHYENPKPTVQAWIERDGEFLALRRNREPMKGRWNMPGGFVERGESGSEAAAREVREETGLEVEVVEALGAFPSRYGSGEEAEPILGLAYRCRVAGGVEEISDESDEAGWFSLAAFPEPAFADEQRVLALLRARRD
jgi:ADP-ribose pyrophosphatase YjhB (NUDIX family)